MITAEILQVVSIIAIIIVGYILSRQIKSQAELLAEYKGYISVMDWKEVRDKYEQFKIPHLKEGYEKQIQDQLTKMTDGAFEALNKVYRQRDDFVFVAALYYSILSEEGKLEFDHDFPRVVPFVKALLAQTQSQTRVQKETPLVTGSPLNKGEGS